MFPGVATSVTWGHISCIAIAPALRSPKFLSVQITADNSAKPWSYLCQCCDKTTHCSPALEIPLSDSVTHGSFSPYIIMVLQPPLLQGISHHKHYWLFLLKIEPQQISYMINSVHPQDMTGPFPWTLINAFSLWLASTFYLTLIYLCSQIPRSLLALFKEIRFAYLLRRMSPKSEAFSLNKIQSLCLCRPFPMPEAHPARHSWLGPACSHLHQTLSALAKPQPLVGSVILNLLPAFSGRWAGPGGIQAQGWCRLRSGSLPGSAHPAGKWPERHLVCISFWTCVLLSYTVRNHTIAPGAYSIISPC